MGVARNVAEFIAISVLPAPELLQKYDTEHLLGSCSKFGNNDQRNLPVVRRKLLRLSILQANVNEWIEPGHAPPGER